MSIAVVALAISDTVVLILAVIAIIRLEHLRYRLQVVEERITRNLKRRDEFLKTYFKSGSRNV